MSRGNIFESVEVCNDGVSGGVPVGLRRIGGARARCGSGFGGLAMGLVLRGFGFGFKAAAHRGWY